jgi:hypothetical protein
MERRIKGTEPELVDGFLYFRDKLFVLVLSMGFLVLDFLFQFIFEDL